MPCVNATPPSADDHSIAIMAWTRRSAIPAIVAAVVPGVRRAQAAAVGPEVAPLCDGMGAYRSSDASRSAVARRYVAQGLVLGWGFNPAEAARSFGGALAHDPHCAAALWGQAWALGPTINADMAADDAGAVDAALRRALALRSGASPRWRGLVDALAARHPRPGTVDEEAYEASLRTLLARDPRDADIATLAAEALMNLHPYDWWHRDGHAQPWTAEIERRLRAALALDAGHPGANHAWVHLMETSPAPRRAAAEAERLRTLVPGSGHLLHMPAHIDMRLGRYAAAVQANERAIEADRRYIAQVDAQGAYRVGYVAHNHHFLWAAASMQGASVRAIAAADEAYAAACGPRRGERGVGTLQLFQALPLYARVRFGRWQELLTGVRPPDGDAPFALAIWHYARGTALARTGRLDEAERERRVLETMADAPALVAVRLKAVHPATALATVARLTLRADLALARGRTSEALPLLAEAVAIEDGLERDEPHLWLAPTRHALGAAFLRAAQPAAAATAFEQDLRHYPDNGWSLLGLQQAQQALGLAAPARRTAARRAAAWRDADVTLDAPRL